MAVDSFLKLDGIKGESIDDKHKDEIDIESFSWGLANSGAATQGSATGGAGAGKVAFQDFHFTMKVNRASPPVFLHCATGEHIREAALTMRKAGDRQLEFLKITLTDCVVSSYQQGGAFDLPSDSFSLNFAKIEYVYVPEKADGSPDQEVRAGYDLAKNQKV
jgi:type VI secretion system secreted protein Hcp